MKTCAPTPEDMEALARLRRENHSLHAINAALRQELAVAQGETAAVSRRERQLTQELGAIRNSVPWKLLKPLRDVRRKLLGHAAGAPQAGPREAIGVFVHLYYDDLAPELAGYLCRIPEPKRVYVSTDTAEKAQRIADAFVAAGLGSVVDVRTFPNRGFDIGPFLVGFDKEIRQHALIVRLHGKKSSHLGEEAGTAWRRMLLDSLLGEAGRVDAILAAFNRYPDLGMVCPEHWDGLYRLYDAPIAIGSNLDKMAELLARYDVPLAAGTPVDFPSGSMFWCRPQALAPWLRFGFSWESFEESRDEARDASLAHALERLFLFGCGLEGLTWARANRLLVASGVPETTR